MVTHKKRPLNWDPGVGRQHGALQSGDTELTWGRGGGELHFKPQPTSYPGVAASQGALPDHGLPWGPTLIPGRGSCHSPSGRVNSRKVGSETTVWEMVCTGSNTQVTSLGRQDLTQRTVSVFSWRSLRGARTQERMRKLEPAHLQRPGSREEQQAARRGELAQRRLHQRTAMASTARCSVGIPPCKRDWDPDARDTPRFPSALAVHKRGFAICQHYGLSSSFQNSKTHAFIHSLNKYVLRACWASGAGDTKGVLPHGALDWVDHTGHK